MASVDLDPIGANALGDAGRTHKGRLNGIEFSQGRWRADYCAGLHEPGGTQHRGVGEVIPIWGGEQSAFMRQLGEEMATRRVNGFHASCPIIRGIRREPSELSATGPRRVVHSD